MAELYRKKPVVIEALQLDESYDTGFAVIAWITRHGGEVVSQSYNEKLGRFHGLAIKTLEGTMSADPGDWIIRGVRGEFYPCKPDIFEATYEAVDAARQGDSASGGRE